MSTFSSVLRKPGQILTPRAAPRRNVQRQAHKVGAAADLEVLTPESVSDSPKEPTFGVVEASFASSAIQENGAETRLPTPPTTATVPRSPPPGPTQEPIQIRNREHSLSVPLVIPEEAGTRAGEKRKAKALEEPGAAPAHNSARTVPKAPVAVSKPRPSKKRKVAPQGAPSYLLSRSHDAPQTTSPVTPAQPSITRRRSSSRHRQRASSEIQDLLQRSRRGLSTVSELSRSIDDTTRRLRSRSGQESTGFADAQDNDENDEEFQHATRGYVADRMGDLASAVVGRAVSRGRKLHRKRQTPEDPESYQIDPDEVHMADLVKDSGLGKMSETGRRLDSEWTIIKARWDQAAEKNRKDALEKKAKEKEKKVTKEKIHTPEIHDRGQQMEIRNGQLILPEDQRQHAFQHDVVKAAEVGAQSAVEDEPIYKYVNSNRIGRKAGKIGGPQARWGEENTDLFYRGLRMFGTDFQMIANMLFPGKTRKEIKDKFVREERSNHARIIANTRQREEVNLEELMKSNELGELKDPETVMQEIEVEAANLKKQQEERRAQENGEVIVNNDEADLPIPSIEVDGLEDGIEEMAEIAEEAQPPPSVELESGLVRTVESARPKQRKPRQPKRATRDTSKAKASRKGKKPLEGVEERIGTIDDVER